MKDFFLQNIKVDECNHIENLEIPLSQSHWGEQKMDKKEFIPPELPPKLNISIENTSY